MSLSAERLPREARQVELPSPGGPFAVALLDLNEALRLAPVWLHSGWIDVVWKFRRTRIGPFWYTLGLAAFVLTMGTIWGFILRQDPAEYFRYVTTSLIVWTLIASLITEGAGVLVAGQATALSMRFPFVAFACAHVWRAVLLFAHHFVLYVAVMVFTVHSPGWPVLLAPIGLVLIVANGVWISLLIGMICLRWRDLGPATSTAMQIMLFVTPVFWSPQMLGPELALAAELNPLFHLIRVVRDPLLGNVPPVESWIWVLGTLVVGMVVTLWAYGRFRDRMPYWY